MSAGIATWLAVSTFAAGLPADLLGFVSCVVVMLVVTPLTQEIDPPRGLVQIRKPAGDNAVPGG
jgi:hypothetical protein